MGNKIALQNIGNFHHTNIVGPPARKCSLGRRPSACRYSKEPRTHVQAKAIFYPQILAINSE